MYRGLELCIAWGAQLGLGPDYVHDRTWTSHEDKVLDNTIRMNPHVPQNVLFDRTSALLCDRSPASCAHRYEVCAHLGGWNPAHDSALGNMAFIELEDNWERGLMLSEHLGRRYGLSKTTCEKRLAMLTSAPLGPHETLVFPVPYQVPQVWPPLMITQAGWLENGQEVRGSVRLAAAKCEHLFRLRLVLTDIAMILERPVRSVRGHLVARGFDVNTGVGGSSRRSDWTLAQDRMLDSNRQEGHDWFAISQVFYRGVISPFVPLHRQRIDCMLRYQNADHLGGWARENDGLLEEMAWADFDDEWERLRSQIRPRCSKRTCEVRLLMLQFGVMPYSHVLRVWRSVFMQNRNMRASLGCWRS